MSLGKSVRGIGVEPSIMATSPSNIERMRAYECATGLKPVGVHRPAAGQWLQGLSHRCARCGVQGCVARCVRDARLATPEEAAAVSGGGRVAARVPAAAHGGRIYSDPALGEAPSSIRYKSVTKSGFTTKNDKKQHTHDSSGTRREAL